MKGFCLINETCPAQPAQKSRVGRRFDQNAAAVRQVLETYEVFIKERLFNGTWLDTLMMLEWFVNNVRVDEYLKFTDNKNVVNMCGIERINLKRRVIDNTNVTINVTDKIQNVELNLNTFIKDSVKKFLSIFKNYTNTTDPNMDYHKMVYCGKSLFDLVEEVVDLIKGRAKVIPNDTLDKAQYIQEECMVYQPDNKKIIKIFKAQETQLQNQTSQLQQQQKKQKAGQKQSSGKKKRRRRRRRRRQRQRRRQSQGKRFIPKHLCTICIGSVFDMLYEFLQFEYCTETNTCHLYKYTSVNNIVKDVTDMLEACIETHL